MKLISASDLTGSGSYLCLSFTDHLMLPFIFLRQEAQKNYFYNNKKN